MSDTPPARGPGTLQLAIVVAIVAIDDVVVLAAHQEVEAHTAIDGVGHDIAGIEDLIIRRKAIGSECFSYSRIGCKGS